MKRKSRPILLACTLMLAYTGTTQSISVGVGISAPVGDYSAETGLSAELSAALGGERLQLRTTALAAQNAPTLELGDDHQAVWLLTGPQLSLHGAHTTFSLYAQAGAGHIGYDILQQTLPSGLTQTMAFGTDWAFGYRAGLAVTEHIGKHLRIGLDASYAATSFERIYTQSIRAGAGTPEVFAGTRNWPVQVVVVQATIGYFFR